MILNLGTAQQARSSDLNVSLTAELEFVRNWTVPFALSAAGDRDFKVMARVPYDLPYASQQAATQLADQPQVTVVTEDPYSPANNFGPEDLIFSSLSSQLLLPDFFSALQDWDGRALARAPYRFSRRYSAALADGTLRGIKLETFDAPLAMPYVTVGSQIGIDLTRQRFTVDMDTAPLINVRNAPTLHKKDDEDAASQRVISPHAIRQVLPAAFLSRLFEPRSYSIDLGHADPFDQPVVAEVNVRGPFKLLLTGVINGGVFPKHSLVSFTFRRADGQEISDVPIPGLAYSTNPSIGYFFYYLGSEPGPFTFEYKIPIPDEYTCTQIKIMKWDGNRRAMNCDSLELTEL